MNEALFDLLYIINSVITSLMKLFIIILICKIIIRLRRNSNFINKGEIK